MWTKEEIDRAVAEFQQQIESNPALAAKGVEVDSKDRALTLFQRQFGVSDAEAEQAIKEWVTAHDSLDWDFAAVVRTILERRQGPQ
jgi:hypothetical protein